MMAASRTTPTMTGFEAGLLRFSGVLVPAALAPWAVALVGILAGWWQPEGRWIIYLVGTALAVAGARRWTLAVRERFVREAALPQLLKRKLREIYPLLAPKDADLIERGLRQFFLACLRSHGYFVAMPSRAVDALWSAFSQSPQAYHDWCQSALGYAPEHSPAQVLGRKAHHNDGLRRAWYWACRDEAIDPRRPSRLPLLFALDAKLAIPDGFHYAPDAAAMAPAGRLPPSGVLHFGTDFSASNHCGGFQDFGGAEPPGSAADASDSSDGGDASSGDGGD